MVVSTMKKGKSVSKKQGSLPNMPPLDSAAKLALQLVDCDEEIAAAYESREQIEKRLVDALAATGRLRITVDGRLFEIKNILAKQKIVIRKNREKKHPSQKDL